MAAERFLWKLTLLTFVLCQGSSVESVLCYFNNIDYYTENYTTHYGYTECSECCGDAGYEYCCWQQGDDVIAWVITVGFVSSIVLLTLIITITVCCTVKLTLSHAGKVRRVPPGIQTWPWNQYRHTCTAPVPCQVTSEGNTNSVPLRSENTHILRPLDPGLLPVANCPTNNLPNVSVDAVCVSNSQALTPQAPV